jgi:cysteinyl-tRNA synthetase
MLQIYNNLTRKKEDFKPLQQGKVSMYVCGVTVYDNCHIGHGRTFIGFDMITRYLRYRGYDLNYIRNITDIDDKIIRRSNELGVTFDQLTQKFIKAMHRDFDALGMARPDHEPRATEFMPQIIEMIVTLIENNQAYVTDNGDVYYDVSSFQGYGKLSGQDVEQLRAGNRIEVSEVKQDSVDFALWKSSKENEPSWPSPWGAGRPGWHIECSAMSTCCLGNTFDIHGGGSDLKFPHHENEIAQSEAATGETYANLWMHTGMLQIDKEKMSKSLNNFFSIEDVLEKFDAETVRFFMLGSHYRSLLNYSIEGLEKAHAGLERIYTALRGIVLDEVKPEQWSAAQQQYIQRFNKAMDDDFGTPEALAVLFDLARETNRLKSEQSEETTNMAQLLKYLGNVFGIFKQNPEAFLKGKSSHDDAEIESLIAARNMAREQKDWEKSDQIRDQLTSMNVVLEDKDGVTKWRKG